MKGQISAEMLILLAVVIAIAAVYLMDLGKRAGEQVQEQGSDVLSDVNELSKGDEVCALGDGNSRIVELG